MFVYDYAQEIKFSDSNKGIELRITNILDSLRLERKKLMDDDIELIYWTVDLSTERNQLLVVHRCSGIWSALKIEFSANAIRAGSRQTVWILNESWRITWHSMITRGYLNLPDESTLQKTRKRSDNAIALVVGDGEWYGCRIRTSKRHRAFGYGNPGDKSDMLRKSEPKLSVIYEKAKEFKDLMDHQLSMNRDK